jgi:hypothetical protein
MKQNIKYSSKCIDNFFLCLISSCSVSPVRHNAASAQQAFRTGRCRILQAALEGYIRSSGHYFGVSRHRDKPNNTHSDSDVSSLISDMGVTSGTKGESELRRQLGDTLIQKHDVAYLAPRDSRQATMGAARRNTVSRGV